MSNTVVDQGIKCYRNESYAAYKGDSVVITIPVVDKDDTDIDVSSGYAFDFQVRGGKGVTAVLAFNETSDEVAMGNGSVTISIPAEDTADLVSNSTLFVAARLYKLADSTTVTLVDGTFQIKDSLITRTAAVDITDFYGLPATLALEPLDVVQLAVVIEPDAATDKRVTWLSSDTDVATVSASGLVTAVADGTCDITATSVYDSDFTATTAVTVATP